MNERILAQRAGSGELELGAENRSDGNTELDRCHFPGGQIMKYVLRCYFGGKGGRLDA